MEIIKWENLPKTNPEASIQKELQSGPIRLIMPEEGTIATAKIDALIRAGIIQIVDLKYSFKYGTSYAWVELKA